MNNVVRSILGTAMAAVGGAGLMYFLMPEKKVVVPAQETPETTDVAEETEESEEE